MKALRRGLLLAAILVLGVSSVFAQESISWFDFDGPVFRRAIAEDRLVLLALETPWAETSGRARNEVWNAPEVVRVVKTGFLAVRARADLRPDLARRYPAEGWPAVSVLLPDGSPLFLPGAAGAEPRRVTAGFLPAADMAKLLNTCVGYFRADRNAALALAQQRETLTEQTAVPKKGTAAEGAAWAIGDQIRTTFDRERRYFGGPPRLPRTEVIELMLMFGAETEEPWRTLGLSALDTLSNNLVDPQDGGLRRMANGLDWEDPQPEKLLDRNARYLDVLTLAWRVTARRAHRDRVLSTAKFIVDRLGREDGYFDAGLAPAAPGGRDRTVLSAWNGLAAAALIRAGAATGEAPLIERGLATAKALREQRWRPGRLVPRAVENGVATLTGYLEDQTAVCGAFLAAYEVTGEKAWLDAASDLAIATVNNLGGRDVGALQDVIAQPGAPRPLRRAQYPLNANMELARLLVRMRFLLEQPQFGRKAREILDAFAGSYDRVPLWTPHYAIASYEFFTPPLTVAVVSGAKDPAAAGLRRAGMGAAFPFVIVGSFEKGRDDKRISAMGLSAGPAASAWGNHGGMGSLPESDPDALRGVLAGLREKYVIKRDEEKGTAAPPKGKTGPPQVVPGGTPGKAEPQTAGPKEG